MCGKIKPSKNLYRKFNILREPPGVVEPGGKIFCLIGFDTKELTFGFNDGKIYNIRSETIHQKFPKYKENYCGVIVDRFEEQDKTFRLDSDSLLLAVYNENSEFAILTTNSRRIGRAPVIRDWQDIAKRESA